jgi:hypothetical protein
MASVNRVLCLEDGLEVCLAGSERRWQIVAYSVRLDSSTGENSALIPPSGALTKQRFDTVESLVAALRREIEIHGEPVPARPVPAPPSALPRSRRA